MLRGSKEILTWVGTCKVWGWSHSLSLVLSSLWLSPCMITRGWGSQTKSAMTPMLVATRSLAINTVPEVSSCIGLSGHQSRSGWLSEQKVETLRTKYIRNGSHTVSAENSSVASKEEQEWPTIAIKVMDHHDWGTMQLSFWGQRFPASGLVWHWG